MNGIPAIPEANPEACRQWLVDLFNAGLAFHPEDCPREIVHHTPAGWERVFTDEEADYLAQCMEIVYEQLDDPCAVLLELDVDTMPL